ncbi:hypothetical protein LCGC14_1119970 [marine sediment metagenome]|uniref:Uncharacterized protein n=1 Tax=marine sediment metagenome TaxID=412755 RepID=A0A0F9MS16_9ZZZZ
MSSRPWVACYWRYYRGFRKLKWPPSHARREAGKMATGWWNYMKMYKELHPNEVHPQLDDKTIVIQKEK